MKELEWLCEKCMQTNDIRYLHGVLYTLEIMSRMRDIWMPTKMKIELAITIVRDRIMQLRSNTNFTDFH